MTLRQRVNRRRKRSRAGVAMTEFAIILPVFVLLMLGIIEFGRAVMIQQVLVNAAREGARRAVIPGATNADVTARVDSFLISVRSPGRQTDITDENDTALDLSTADPNDIIRIRVSVPYNEVGLGLTPHLIDSTMAAVVQMRKE